MKFTNKQLKVEINAFVGKNNMVWFKGKEIARALGYKNPKNAIRSHVDEMYKCTSSSALRSRSGFQVPQGEQPHTIWISEPGLYCLLFHCRMTANEELENWVTLEVLPSIRGHARELQSRRFDTPNKLVFKMENEYDLHTKVVEFMRKRYPSALVVAGLGELQDTSKKRIDSWKKGYQKGQPDLVIQNLHRTYSGLCIEFKTPPGNGVLSESQKAQLEKYRLNNYKVVVSNDYDSLVDEIKEYMRDLSPLHVEEEIP